jgi:hypothetical protein
MNENNGEDFEDIDFSPEGLGKLMFSKQEVNIILSTDEFDFDTQVLK